MEKNSDEYQDLHRGEAIEKMKELVKHNSICMFSTSLDTLPINSRPMGAQQVDENGDFWFLSPSDSSKNHEITADQRVQLFFANTSNSEFLSVYGKASITRDRVKLEEIWNPIAKAWFEEGIDDPRITLIRVTPEDAYYWDTKDGKMISMIKFAASAITGKTLIEGVQGKLSVR